MAESDILNPVAGLWDQLGDNPTWNYGWNRKKAVNQQVLKPRAGAPYSRDILNAGHSFEWNWVDRPWATMQRLAFFYENFRHGYFTVIDYDGGGRHYVGRFTTAPYANETANNKYTAQGVVFEEVPSARMLVYPSDWVNDGAWIYPVDDFLRPAIATSAGSAWVTQLAPGAADVTPVYPGFSGLTVPMASAPSQYEMYLAAPNPNDFAQQEYVGWGLQIFLRTGPGMGKCDVLLDNAAVLTGLDCYCATANGVPACANTGGGATVAGQPGFAVVTVLGVPLDKHRVKLLAKATKNPLSTGYALAWDSLQVMR